MVKKVDIIDCGVGNIKSAFWAFSKIGADVEIRQDPHSMRDIDYLVLPGVGAFKSVMGSLKEKYFFGPVKEHIESGKPMLGICVGMQVLFEKGFEFGEADGMGLIEGAIHPMPIAERQHMGQQNNSIVARGIKKRPFVNWSGLIQSTSVNWENSILHGLRPGDEMYFVHSMEAHCKNDKFVIASADHGGYRVCAVVQRDNVFGTQFHPEKSGNNGLKVLYNFLQQ